MDEHVVLKEQSYWVVFLPEYQRILVSHKKYKNKEHRIDGRIHYILQGEQSKRIIIFVFDALPKVYDPQTHTIATVRNPKGSIYSFSGENILISSISNSDTYWMKKHGEYQRVFESDLLYSSYACTVVKRKDGQKVLLSPYHNIPIVPEKTSCVYPMVEVQEVKQEVQLSNPPTFRRNKSGFPIEAILAKEAKFKYQIAISPKSSYLIQFSYGSSDYRVWKKEGDLYFLTDIKKGHSCSLRSVTFLGRENYFSSLDSAGKLKIWLLEESMVTCCQTADLSEFQRKIDYVGMLFNAEDATLDLSHKLGNDIYAISLETYKRKAKNNIITFLRRYEKCSVDVRHSQDSRYQSQDNKIPPSAIQPRQTKQSVNKPPISVSSGYQLSKISEDRANNNNQSTNPNKSRITKQTVEINVGVDFGTSRTKVCWRPDTKEDRHPRIMFFDEFRMQYHGNEFENWTVPSMVSEVYGDYLFGYDSLLCSEGIKFKNLKTTLFHESTSDDKLCACAAFIAYISEMCKDKIKKDQALDDSATYAYSICLPVEQMNNNGLVDNMHFVLALAETIVAEKCYHSSKQVFMCLSKQRKEGCNSQLSYFQIIPESAAEIADSLDKRQQSGYYLLFDFGAGTTDMTMFHYRADRKAKSEMLGAKICYKGFSDIEDKLKKSKRPDDIIRNHYKLIFEEFKESSVWSEIKEKRQGPGTMSMFREMKILASGGASQNAIVKEVFCQYPLHDDDGNGGYSGLTVLTDPPKWGTEKVPYYRYAVAYGLSGNPRELKENFILPKDCQVIECTQEVKEQSEDEILESQRRFHKK